jgi:hypothetical protein
MERYVSVPLSEPAKLAEISNGLITHDLRLPVGTDDERIILYPHRLLRLARSAGAQSLHLTFDRSALQPDEVYIENIGGGVGILKGFKKIDYLGNFEYDDRTNPNRHAIGINSITDLSQFRAQNLTLELSSPAIKERISQDKKNVRGPLDEALWSKYLDSTIRSVYMDASAYRFGGENLKSVGDGMTRKFALTYEVLPPFVFSGIFTVAGLSAAESTKIILPLLGSVFWGATPTMTYLFDKAKKLDAVFSLLYISHADKVLSTFVRSKCMPTLVGLEHTSKKL